MTDEKLYKKYDLIQDELRLNGSPMVTIETNDERTYFLIDILSYPDFIESSFTLNNVENDPKDNPKEVVEHVIGNVTKKISSNITDRQRLIVKRLIATGEEHVLENVTKNVTKNIVVNFVENSVTLARHFHVVERTIKRDLNVLQELGFIKHEGHANGGKWVVLIKLE